CWLRGGQEGQDGQERTALPAVPSLPALPALPASMIRLLAVDIDGTLLDSRGRVPDAHRDALVEAAARGVDVALVTGRSFHFSRPVADALPLPLILIVNNGALVKDKSGQTHLRTLLPRDAARAVLAGTRIYEDSVALVFDRPPG